jgi:hypothetical protein
MTTDEIKNKFIELIGKDNVDYIESNNWMKYGFEHDRNTITINFLEKDGKNDSVIYHTISYYIDDEVFVSENCVDSDEIPHKSFENLKKHIESIEDDLIDNGYSTIDI